MKLTEIRDSYFVTYGIFYSMGVLTFVPHQFFTTSTDYWMFKFRDPLRDDDTRPPPDDPDPGPYPDPGPGDGLLPNFFSEIGYAAHERTPLQANFTSSFYITCQLSMLGFLVVTALFSKKLPPPPKKILGALSSMLVLFLINTAFTKINTDTFQVAFFGITLVLAVLLNLSSAVTMISLFELVTKFPLGYYSAILSGQALCGIFSSLVQILILSLNTESSTNGLIYFGMGSLIILLTAVFYLITKKKSKYFVYRIGQYEGTTEIEDKWAINLGMMKAALQRSKWFLGAMVFVQGSTAMIHPGLAALIVSTEKDSGNGGEWSEVYFVPVITFLCFHSADFIGRETARKVQRPTCAFLILALAILRLSLVPLLMLCNAQPRNHMHVYFGDNYYIIFIIIFGYSQGFLVNLCFISIPVVVRKEELEFVTILVPLFSVVSVTICSAFNLLIISLI